jgi:predicted amidohydrolase
MGDYRKQFPTRREQERGIVPGDGPGVWTVGPVRIGVAICADCLYPETFAAYAAEQIDILFVPNASPYKPDESVQDKFGRDERIFVDGAKRAGAYLVKTCGVGTLFGGRLQGRSLVAAPWGVINRVPPEEEDRAQVITANLSLDELHEFRRVYAVTPADLPA